MVIIVDMADLNSTEVVAQVSVRHPEEAFRVVVAALRFDIVGPEFRIVAPAPVPFEVTPWISQHDEFYLISICIGNFCSFKQAVGMLGDKTELL